VHGNTYTVEPLFEYELYGMIVSRHHSDNWFDYHHEEWKDFLNVADLCVVYGDNISSGIYRKMRFSSQDYYCYGQFDKNEDAVVFSENSFSNNHVLSDKPSLIRMVKQVWPGDQVYMKGYLVNYYRQGHADQDRPSSISRDDRGCEVIFLKDFKILRSASSMWRTISSMAGFMALAMVFLLMSLHTAIFSYIRGCSQQDS
jgi:hypothetical protein